MLLNILTAQFNITIIKFLQQFSNPFLDKLAQAITMTAEEYFIIIFIGIVYLCIDKELGYMMSVTLLFSSTINYFVKCIFKVKRPIGTPGVRSLRLQTADGYSFPSGHTQGAAVFWGSLMERFKKRFVYIFGVVMIVLVALSRLYLGVHRPVDVVGGFILGIFCVIVLNRIFQCEGYKKNLFLLLFIVLPMIIITVYINDSKLYRELGAIIGFIIGYNIENKYIKFNPKTSVCKNLIKVVISVSGLLIISILFKKLLPHGHVLDLITYFCGVLWFTAGDGLIIVKLGL